MSRSFTVRLLVLVSLLACASEAAAQQPPPPVVQPAPTQPPPVQPQPQTMRWTLANGQVFDGYEAGGDANFVMVQTSAGIMQVPRNQVVSAVPIATAGVMMTAQPQAMPLPPAPPPRRRRPGRGLIIAGAVVFGVSYGLSALVGLSATTSSSDAAWWAVPIAGPLIWASQSDCDSDDFDPDADACRSLALSFGTFVTIVQ